MCLDTNDLRDIIYIFTIRIVLVNINFFKKDKSMRSDEHHILITLQAPVN